MDDVIVRLESRYPHRLIVDETRRILAEMREEIRSGKPPETTSVEERVAASLDRLAAPSLIPVVNATGVVLHTNLGRAPIAAFEPIRGYSNLEYDLSSGRRGKRDSHIAPLLERLVGRPGIAVNNNAAAVFLTLNELAAGGEVIVSRGELIEIGDGFRIPEIMLRAGVTLREVGTTNRTRIDDYRAALNERTRMILRVHPSNFHITGFSGRPALRELAALAKESSVPLYEDLGSGYVGGLREGGFTEPAVADSFAAGVDVVSFSCDKLLGGPQAGIIAGNPALVQRVRRNPLFRALRVDKLITQSLERTLQALLFERYDDIPALQMLRLRPEVIVERAEWMCSELGDSWAEIVAGESLAGGGSTPDQSIPTWLIAIRGDAAELERKLRSNTPAIIGRIAGGQLLIDLRTVLPEQDAILLKALKALTDNGEGGR